ncbi:hypothetical protein Ciccas_004363 [Cichlidogyrus casuarinus]|uniref:F-box domain-containing protein n=1 Tax=Cichlidogyrus casuarinus TaxID=1844966 RepID=A0ABD2QBU5_9PLAT
MDTRRFGHRRQSQGYLSDEFQLSRLPEKLILRVFSYLTHKELCTIARVCKQWRRIAYDEHLWMALKLRPEYGGLNITNSDQLFALINQRSGSSLRYIELNSDLITIPVLEELGNKCTNLKFMTLDFSNAMQLHDFNELMAFPGALYYLCICLSDVIFMEGLMRKIYHCLSSLEVLHLIGTFERGTEEEEEIYEVINISKIKAHTPNLTVVNLYGITFIEDSHVELLASNCIHLEYVALNYCLNVKGASFNLLLSNCTRLTTMLLKHCSLEDEHMMVVPWENSKISELDISSTELSSECLENILTRMPGFTYLAVSHVDFFNNKTLNALIDGNKLRDIRALDLSCTPELTEEPLHKLVNQHGEKLRGFMLHGKPQLTEYFWTMDLCFGCSTWLVLQVQHTCACRPDFGEFRQSLPKPGGAGDAVGPRNHSFQREQQKVYRSFTTLTLEDGKYYEMVKGNFERAARQGVVRTTTVFNTTIYRLLRRFTDLKFN